MVQGLSRHWWLFVLRGVLAIIFGILALVMPGAALFALVTLFGAWSLVNGVLAVITAFRTHAGNTQWWALLIEGLIGIAAGIFVLVWPGISTYALLFAIAVWAVVTGIFELVQAIRLRREIDNEWALGFLGVLSIALGVLLFVNPAAGAIGMVWAIGWYAILFGILNIYLGFRVRSTFHQYAA